MSLYHKYRPTKLDEMVGQPGAVRVLEGLLKRKGGIPHALLFYGPSGTGKTTAARIIADELGCVETDRMEYNCGICEPMATVKEIDEMVRRGGTLTGAGTMCWILDEFQALSRAQYTQQALLKILEEAKPNIYFLLATTDPTKILATVRNRCTIVEMKSLSSIDVGLLVTRVAKAEGLKIEKAVLARIVELAAGSARQSLVMLDAIAQIKDPDEQLESLPGSMEDADSFELVKKMLPFDGSHPIWKDVREVLKKIENKDAEGIRRMVLSAARNCLLRGGGGVARAFLAIQVFRDPYFDETKAAHAYLCANCYEVCGAKTR